MNRHNQPARITSAIALALALASASAQQASPTYPLRAPPSVYDGAIPRHLSRESPIPLYKRYAELTAEERAALKRNWEPMPEEDEPPFPLRGLRPIHAAMSKIQGHLQAEGDLSLIVSVSPTGEVTEVKALGAPGADLINAAATVLFDTRFKPGVCGGQPCAMQYPFRFKFEVK